MKPAAFLISNLILWLASSGEGQITAKAVNAILQIPLERPEVVRSQLLNHLLRRTTPVRVPLGPKEWAAQSKRFQQEFEAVIFHGWPREWITSLPRFEEIGTVAATEGYRIRKLRYEVVPGFWSAALLYEPIQLRGKAPAILNLLGHYRDGKAMAFEQKRCINYALQGMFALDLEWLGYGELRHAENSHWFAADLDLVGANGVGLFYLAMRRGLDYLEQQRGVDPTRLGVTGLSGGGWQTILLAGLDSRVTAAVPVAGTCSLISKLDRPEPSNIGDLEEVPTDLLEGRDYAHLLALRSPRPTLLIYNANDSCCYQAPLTRPYLYDNVLPIFSLGGRPTQLRWYENIDPGTHNYEQDNRQQSYRFFAEQFGLPTVEHEVEVESRLRTAEQLTVGLPQDNLTIVGLARKLAAGIQREPAPSAPKARRGWAAGQRTKLKALLRYSPVSMAHPWMLASTREHGLESISYRLEFEDGLSATGVRLKPTAATNTRLAPVTFVLMDDGKRSAGAAVSDALNRGQQVFALDLLLTGDAAPDSRWEYAALLATTGERPLSLEAAQLIATAKWLRQAASTAQPIHLEATGPRSQMVALAAAALEPSLFSQVTVRNGFQSLRDLLDQAIPYKQAPELFCLDLLKDFDLDILQAIAGESKPE